MQPTWLTGLLTAITLTGGSLTALADDHAEAHHANAHTHAPRTVAVSGTAFTTVMPDLARLTMTVTERDAELASAQAAVAARTAAVLAVLDRLKVPAAQVDSTGASIRPDYRYNRSTETQELRGYVVERRIAVELRTLDRLGAVIEQSVAAGVNQLSPAQLDSSRRREVRREALAKAVADARLNAVTLAAAAGDELGPVLSMSAGGAMPPPMPMLRAVQADAMAAEAATETYQSGELRFDATVNIVYQLQP